MVGTKREEPEEILGTESWTGIALAVLEVGFVSQ